MAKFFINRPVVAMVISILTVIAGVVAMTRLPIGQLPDIVPPQISVATIPVLIFLVFALLLAGVSRMLRLIV